MNERKMIQMAAKAAGYTLNDHYDADGRYWPWCSEINDYWQPLEDDGDAFRLMVKLRLCSLFPMRGDRFITVGAGQVGSERPAWFEPVLHDPCKAMRTSIVCAAVETLRQRKTA